MSKTNKKSHTQANRKRLEFGAGIVMAAISIIIPFLSLIVIPVSIILLCGGILLMTSTYSKDSIWKSFVFPFLIIVFCAVSLFVWHFYYKESKQLNFATPDALISPVLQNMNIRISDLTRDGFRIRNKTFINCHIYGPAIISGNDSVMSNNGFWEVDPNGVFIETLNKFVSGVVSLDNCVIRNCNFHRISFIGSPEQIKQIKTESQLVR
jgi:hypothetical protein